MKDRYRAAQGGAVVKTRRGQSPCLFDDVHTEAPAEDCEIDSGGAARVYADVRVASRAPDVNSYVCGGVHLVPRARGIFRAGITRSGWGWGQCCVCRCGEEAIRVGLMFLSLRCLIFLWFGTDWQALDFGCAEMRRMPTVYKEFGLGAERTRPTGS